MIELEHFRRLVLWVAIVLSLSMGVFADTPSSLPEDYIAYRQQALSGLQAEYLQVCRDQANEVGVKKLLDRMALVDEVSNLVIRRLDGTRSEVLDAIVDDIVQAPRGSQGKGLLLSAAEIYMEYVDQFRQPLPAPAIADSELAILRRYYEAVIAASETYIQERGKPAGNLSKDAARDVRELYFVMSFLHVPDDAWTDSTTASLPEWMKDPLWLGVYEKLALRTERPLTAVTFARLGSSNRVKDAAVLNYLAEEAEAMIKDQNYRAAIACQKARLKLATEAGNEDIAGDAGVAVAKLYLQMGHPGLAAGATEELLKNHPKAGNWAQVAVLRLKYLYESGQFTQILAEAPIYQTDERSKPCLAQIMYIAWVTYRHESKTKEAGKTQRQFLEMFPESPLCADLYFASAMEAVAAGQYDEALRLLEVIEYRYPKSQVFEKAKSIKQRLSQTGKKG
ncbi:MAG: hypothetical protein WC869_05555 [Phycisphaerae bacterium]|jgi:tetratricopeptide (TPR) repeat protein